jgi:excisionase family DNA binding protein
MANWKEDVVLTTEEAAQYLKISKPTLSKHLHSGKIKGIKVGRSWRFLQSELYRFLLGEEGTKR